MRAMPSPTDSTWPTSVTSASASKLRISRFRIAEISDGWISISGSFHGRTQGIELGAQGGIDHARADAEHEPAEQPGIDMGGEQGIAAELFLQHALELACLRIGEGAGRGHFGGDLAPVARQQFLEGADHGGQHVEAALLRQEE